MKRVFKYSLEVTDEQTIELPRNTKILCVQTQNGFPQLWALIDDEEKRMKKVIIAIHGTGHPIDNDEVLDREYISTFQLSNGSLVFHVFKIER
jgi:hypothetical protein